MSEALKDGGPAFPVGEEALMRNLQGASLRDYFAAKAMAIVPEKSCWNMKSNESDADYIARRSYEVADAMLKAREQK